jgi:hypothetical protein
MDIRCPPNTQGKFLLELYYSAPHHVSSNCSSLKSTLKYINDLFALNFFFFFFFWALKFS